MLFLPFFTKSSFKFGKCVNELINYVTTLYYQTLPKIIKTNNYPADEYAINIFTIPCYFYNMWINVDFHALRYCINIKKSMILPILHIVINTVVWMVLLKSHLKSLLASPPIKHYGNKCFLWKMVWMFQKYPFPEWPMPYKGPKLMFYVVYVGIP